MVLCLTSLWINCRSLYYFNPIFLLLLIYMNMIDYLLHNKSSLSIFFLAYGLTSTVHAIKIVYNNVRCWTPQKCFINEFTSSSTQNLKERNHLSAVPPWKSKDLMINSQKKELMCCREWVQLIPSMVVDFSIIIHDEIKDMTLITISI